MMKIAILVFLEISALLWLSACQRGSANTEPSSLRAAQPGAPLDSIELEPAMLAQIKVERLQRQNLPKLLTATGKVQFNEDRTAHVLAPLPGQVMDLHVRIGDQVGKAVLFSIRSREVAGMVTDYLDSQRDRDLAEKTATMTKDLFEHNAASQICPAAGRRRPGQGQRSQWRAPKSPARTRHRSAAGAAERRRPGRSCPCASPSRHHHRAPSHPGQFVTADSSSLFTIADLSTVWVMVDVFESDIHLVHPGQRVQVTRHGLPRSRFNASRPHRRQGGSRHPHSEGPAAGGEPGRTAQARNVHHRHGGGQRNRAGVTVPSEALFTEGDHGYVFIAVGERTFERRRGSAVPRWRRPHARDQRVWRRATAS